MDTTTILFVMALLVIVVLLGAHSNAKTRAESAEGTARRAQADLSRLQEQVSALQSGMTMKIQDEVHSWRERELTAQAETRAETVVEKWKIGVEASIREDAIKRSGAVIAGKISEHLAPYMPGFAYNARDVRFIGSPVDLVVFDGLSENALRRIVFVEIKTGASTLSTRERDVRDAILLKQIEWQEFRLPMPR